ncbi:MFS transporter [Dactylosporangium aurantiacum]|uniref:MFS transporter n=1 Tax=Dactylosporangium aurantiacum TaxID=35754 RepID=A0A9Q9IJT0_9ACTN|nr:MFS transporter [Dactylosporangium aurantiacum]MDG6104066.1 MFS transporter [Dactylosporangium aurantiacum]UWZ56916.1 MFS transporter [Dactylosporangium aurantiacum]
MTRALTLSPPPVATAPATAGRFTFVALAAAAAAFSMLQSLVSPVLPTIQRDLHTSQSTVTWVLTAWLLSAAVATPIMGRIGDMYGKRRTLLVALAAIAVGCVIAAVAPNVGVLIVGRVIQGLGGAVFPISFGILRDELPPARVASAIGGLSAVIAVGGGLGVVLAGPIVDALDWRALFWIPTVVVAGTFALALRFVAESPVRAPGRINWLAGALLSGWLVALILPLSKAPVWGWTSVKVVVPLIAALILIVAWVLVELRSAEPLIDMHMMRLPAVWTTNLVALLFGAGMFATYAFLPQFLQTPRSTGYGFGTTVTGAGLAMLPMLVTMALAGFVSGPLTAYVPTKVQLLLGTMTAALACGALTLFHDAYWQVAVATGAFGVGLGLTFTAMVNLIVHTVPAGQTAVASGMNANIRTIGGSLGAAVASAVITAHVTPAGLPLESGYTYAFAVLTAMLAAAAVIAVLVPRGRRA